MVLNCTLLLPVSSRVIVTRVTPDFFARSTWLNRADILASLSCSPSVFLFMLINIHELDDVSRAKRPLFRKKFKVGYGLFIQGAGGGVVGGEVNLIPASPLLILVAQGQAVNQFFEVDSEV